MNYDKPLQIDTSVKIYETPKIDITKEQFTDAYVKGLEEASKTVYAIGKKFSQLDKEMEQNKEFLRVSEEIEQARADYNKEWENPEKINLNDENWVTGRNEALTNLRTAEFDIIKNSKLNNMSKEKLAKTSNSNYRERGVRYVFQQGDFTRKRNLDLALTNIDSYIGFLETTDLESDREYIMNKINNSRDILRKYGVDMAMTDLGIVNKIDDAMKKSMKEQINQLFMTMDPEQATQQANTLVAENSQKFARIVSQLDDVPKDANAYEFMESFYKANKQEMSKYIGNMNNIIKREKEQKAKDNEKGVQEAYYKRDTSKYLDYKFGIKNVSTSQLLNNPDILKLVTDIPAEDFAERGLAFPFITEGLNSTIKGRINDRMKDVRFSLRESYDPLYEFATDIAGEGIGSDSRRKNILIDFALKNDIKPDVILKGENNPEYFRIGKMIGEGGDLLKSNNLKYDEKKLRENKQFIQIANAFSKNWAVGEKLALAFLAGKASVVGEKHDFLANPVIYITKNVTKKNVAEFLADVGIAREITLTRIDYNYVNYKTKDDKRDKKEEERGTIETETAKKQQNLFGGE